MSTLAQIVNSLDALIMKGRFDDARQGIASLIQKFPHLREAHELQLNLARKEKCYSSIETPLQALIGKTAPKLPRYIASCYKLRAAKELPRALDIAEAAVAEYSETPEAHVNYLGILLDLGKYATFIRNLIYAYALLNEKELGRNFEEIIAQFIARLLCDDIEAETLVHISEILESEIDENDQASELIKIVYDLVSRKITKTKLTVVEPTKVMGSITHYNHFFGAVSLPMLKMLEMSVLPQNATFILPFCGPMAGEAREILQAYDNDVVFVPEKVFDYLAQTPELYGHPSKITLPSYDAYWDFGHHAPRSAIDEARDALKRFAQQKGHSLENTSNKCAITFVDRSNKIDPFYIKEKRTTGAMRRCIPNAQALVSQLKEIKDASVSEVLFENLSLIDKFALMQTTDVFIVQHGAALTAIYWLPPGATVVEIVPKDLGQALAGLEPAPVTNVRPAGQLLAEQMGVNYYRVLQDAPHSQVNIEVVAGLCKTIASRRSTKGG